MAVRYADQLPMGLMDLCGDADYTWMEKWDSSGPGTSSSRDHQPIYTMEGHSPDEAESSRGRSIGKITPPRSESASSLASNTSCRSCSATFARPDVRKRHEDEKHSTKTKKVTCGSWFESWGCGKEYANARSLKDHWSKEAKDGTGKKCKAEKERISASFPPKNDPSEHSSSQLAIMWDAHESMDAGHTKEPVHSQYLPPITPARPSTLVSTSIQPMQTKASNIGPVPTDSILTHVTGEPYFAPDRPIQGSRRWANPLSELQLAIPSLYMRKSTQSSRAIVLGALAYIKEIEAKKATLEQRLETEISSLQRRINELTWDLALSNPG